MTQPDGAVTPRARPTPRRGRLCDDPSAHGGATPRASPSIGRSAGAFGDPSEALSSCRKYETEHAGRERPWPRTSGPALSGSLIRLPPTGISPNPLLAILGSNWEGEQAP